LATALASVTEISGTCRRVPDISAATAFHSYFRRRLLPQDGESISDAKRFGGGKLDSSSGDWIYYDRAGSIMRDG
jgi:hypothetical protein